MNATTRRAPVALALAAAGVTLSLVACSGGTTTTAPSAEASAEATPEASHRTPGPSPTLAPGVLATIRARSPMILAATDDTIWVEGHGMFLGRFDPAADQEVAFLTEVATHCDIAVGAGAVWAADAGLGVVTKVDPANGAVLGTITLKDACGLEADDADLWVASPGLNAVFRYDPSSLEQTASIELGANAFWVATGPEGVWAAGEANGGTTYRIDPESETVVAEIATPNPFSTGLEVGFGSAWVPARDAKVIYRIDPATNSLAATITVPSPIGGIAIGSEAIWVSGWGDGMVNRIDPATNQITGSLATGFGNLAPPLEAFGSVWVSDYDRNLILQLDPEAFGA